ncbi:DUF4124 domain-containing protein [Pseudomonas otitidis]|uniref:DUF4124 domain-containing protein n=1 Tax=Metapseudomonas otitidis TaxID=319939 RepID=UPI00244A5DA6|nr:DUF4124 domain-containing protein [Pseudomonas otitidis]MDH1105475.1 DUF4124 domain-containing protein [Pseudomonas otitidis]MDH1158535.1 DUF4124 domain-containing protein [Pseudomonas otitidis]MDH1162519.1 DUF4124 domain-containing protein [Pseudomonas otitidis]
MRLVSALLASALLLTPVASTSAAIFRCKVADGTAQFSDRPCGTPENQEVIAHETPSPAKTTDSAEQPDKSALPKADAQASYEAAEKASPPLLTLADLQGKWSDLDFDSPLRGYWVFGSNTLRMDRKGMAIRNRVQTTLRFKLKGNLLTIIHEPDALHEKRWEERLVVERYVPGRLINLGTLVLYRVR